MEIYEFKCLMEDFLVWQDQERVEKAVEKLAEDYDGDLRVFVLPFHKMFWTGSAMVLAKMGYPKVEPVIFEMLEWLKDINWPGALIIKEFLEKEVPKEVLAKNVKKAIEKAKQEKDTDWMYFMGYLIRDAEIKNLI